MRRRRAYGHAGHGRATENRRGGHRGNDQRVSRGVVGIASATPPSAAAAVTPVNILFITLLLSVTDPPANAGL